MLNQKRIYFFCILLLVVSYCLPIDHANGVRIAGDNEVTPSAPESDDVEAMAPEETDENDLNNTIPGPGEDGEAADAGINASENLIAEGTVNSSATNRTNATVTPEGDKRQGGNIAIDFNNVDIGLFIKFISEQTGKNFLVDSNVKGKITIFSPTKITIEEAYKVFESVLEVNGYTTVQSGSIIKIVPMSEARSKDIDTKIGQEPADPDDRLVTQLIPLKYASPDEIKSVFAPFISKNSVIASYPPTGMLIVTDILSNINRLLEIIEKIDVEGTSEIISVTPLEYAGAESMSKTLTSVFKTTTARSSKDTTSTSIVIVSDTRTNSIITLASEVDTLKIKELIRLLDKETPRGEGELHVYTLQNHDAEELAQVLTAILKGTTSTSSTSATQEGVKETAVVLSEDVQVIPDKATNSLIINAGKDDYLVLEDIIEKLDIVRKMVYIEALIMEVSMTKQFELGVQWYGGIETGSIDGNDVVSFGSSNPGSGNLPSVSSTGTLNFPTGISVGVLGDNITIGSLTFPSIAAVVRAYGTSSDVNILSTPQIMTLDNEEASIKVAENVPVLKSQQTTASNYDYSNYDREDVGVFLMITPQINEERFVKLKIEQTVDQLVSEEVLGLHTTLTREAKTTVVIKDGQTVVIGGLIDETKKNTNYKVPILGDIPILGYLFRSKSESTDKKNLYIFITPHIIETTEESDKVYENKIGQMDKVQEGVISMNKGRVSQTEDERLCDLGFSYLQVKDYDKAAEKYEKALQINPDNPLALLNMGIIYEKKKEFNNAIEMYEKVISLNPDDRAYNAVNPVQTGQKVTDIAKENLENIK